MIETIILNLTVIEKIVIILATAFASLWTYKTFGEKEKRMELKELTSELFNCFSLVFNFYYSNEYKINDSMIKGPAALGVQYERDLSQIIRPFYLKIQTSVYINEKIKKELIEIVSKWIKDEYISKYLISENSNKRDYVEKMDSDLNKDFEQMLKIMKKARK